MGIVMQQDDAVSKFTHWVKCELNAMWSEVLKHPAWSLDLSLYIFHVFGSLRKAFNFISYDIVQGVVV
jgi:hypothetical protein